MPEAPALLYLHLPLSESHHWGKRNVECLIMFFLKHFRSSSPSFSAKPAPDVPICAIGDLHGRYDLLQRMIERTEREAADHHLVFLGDYVDRGPDSRLVLDTLRNLRAERPGRVTCLMGNHEEMMLHSLTKPLAAGRWLRHGGTETVLSYGLPPMPEKAIEAEWNDFSARLHDTLGEETISFLKSLKSYWQSGNIAAVHAGADPAQPIEDQSREILLWGHPDFETTPRRDGTWVVHGHTIQEAATAQAGRIGVDTGAYLTGHLSAAMITADKIEFISV